MTITEMKAHLDKINAQLQEAKALLHEAEAHAKRKRAEAEIERLNALKTKQQEIDKKWEHLKTIGEAGLAMKVRAEVEADLAKLRGSLEEIASRVKTQAGEKSA